MSSQQLTLGVNRGCEAHLTECGGKNFFCPQVPKTWVVQLPAEDSSAATFLLFLFFTLFFS